MISIGAQNLRKQLRRHPSVRGWIEGWVNVVLLADWNDLTDVRKSYSKTDGVKIGSGLFVITVFNAGGNKYRLLTSINYALGTVQFIDLLTHAEYTKDLWKKR